MTEWNIKLRHPDYGHAASNRRHRIRQMEKYDELAALLAKLEPVQPECVEIIRSSVGRCLMTVEKAHQAAQKLMAEAVVRSAPELPSAPPDKIEFQEAWQQARAELARSQELIEGKPDLRTLVRIHARLTDWCHYWAAHHGSEEGKALYAAAAERGEAELADIYQRVEKLRAKHPPTLEI
jgi:hypothetical protein